jgi:hypothetical protein
MRSDRGRPVYVAKVFAVAPHAALVALCRARHREHPAARAAERQRSCHMQLDADGPALSSVFAVPSCITSRFAFGNQLLQTRILRSELVQPPHVIRLEAPENRLRRV